METTDIILVLLESGTRAGLRTEATRDYLSRGLQRFPVEASALDVEAWLKDLKPAAPHLFSIPAHAARSGSPIAPEHVGLSPSERLTRYRPVATQRPRPGPVELTEQQQATLEKLPPTARITQYRKFQTEQV